MIPTPRTLSDLSSALRSRLEGVERELGRPLSLSCNRHLGCESIHGRGVDIRCATAADRHTLMRLVFKHGFERIGLYPGLIHVDIDARPRPALWVGRPPKERE